MRVDTVQATSACQFQKPIGVVATNEHAAAEMEQSETRNHRERHKTRASLLSDKGLDAANHNPRFRRREKNVLDIPSYRTGDYTFPMKKDVKEKTLLPAPLRDAGVVTYIQ